MHLYGIDCGNGALLPLADLPHCGAVVTRTQTERAARLLTRLGAELARRQDLLAEGGFAGITEQRAAAPPAERLPHIVVLLDRWEGFTTTLGETDGGGLTDVITRILAEGASVGMHLVMTGDRSLLAGRISALCEDKLVFKLAEKDDYALAGLRPRDLPDDIGAGPGVPRRDRHRDAGRPARPGPLRPGPGRRAAADRRLGRRTRRRGATRAAPVPGRPAPVPDHLHRRVAAAPGRHGQPPAVGAGRRRRRRADRTRAGPVRRRCPHSSWPARPGRGARPSCPRWPARSWPAEPR